MDLMNQENFNFKRGWGGGGGSGVILIIWSKIQHVFIVFYKNIILKTFETCLCLKLELEGY